MFKIFNSRGSIFNESLKIIIVAIALAVLFRTFVAQAFKIPSESMMETLLVGDHLLIDKLIYRFKEPKRHDIVVFNYPKDPDIIFIKRLIGLPGDEISIVGEQVYVNSNPIDEPYAVWTKTATSSGQFYRFGPITVPENSYFMMGDNRNFSSDSRVWGTLPEELIKGKAIIVHWSWDQNWHVRSERLGKLLY
ncbi:MAG: signal peptidase I [Nitrospinota bacterium]